MSFIGTLKVGTHSFSQLASSQQPITFDDIALGVDPFGLDGIEPGTFAGQKQGENAHAQVFLLDRLVVLTNPGPYQLAVVPGSIIPDQQPTGLANRLQLGATPLQKLGRDNADRTTIHEA